MEVNRFIRTPGEAGDHGTAPLRIPIYHRAGKLYARIDTELVEDRANVCGDRMGGRNQLIGCGTVRIPFGDEVRDSLLRFREGFPAIGWARRRCRPPAAPNSPGRLTVSAFVGAACLLTAAASAAGDDAASTLTSARDGFIAPKRALNPFPLAIADNPLRFGPQQSALRTAFREGALRGVAAPRWPGPRRRLER
jgi:hypothetical protein